MQTSAEFSGTSTPRNNTGPLLYRSGLRQGPLSNSPQRHGAAAHHSFKNNTQLAATFGAGEHVGSSGMDQTGSTVSSRDLSDTPTDNTFARPCGGQGSAPPPHNFPAPHITTSTPQSGVENAAATTETRSTTNLFVRRLSPEVTEEELKSIFAVYGTITNFVLMRNIHTGRSLRKAFVRYATTEEAQAAMAALHETKVRGDPISIQWANRQHDTTPAGDERSKIRKVFIRNIPLAVTREEIETLCRGFGEVSTVSIHADTVEASATARHGGDTPGAPLPPPERRNIAFVLFERDGDAAQAVAGLHNARPFPHVDDGIPLMVKLSEAKKQRMERRKQAGGGGAAHPSHEDPFAADFTHTSHSQPQPQPQPHPAAAPLLVHTFAPAPATATEFFAPYAIGGATPPAPAVSTAPMSHLALAAEFHPSPHTSTHPSQPSHFVVHQAVASEAVTRERSQQAVYYATSDVVPVMAAHPVYVTPTVSRAVSTAYSSPGSPGSTYAAPQQQTAEPAFVVQQPVYEYMCIDPATGPFAAMTGGPHPASAFTVPLSTHSPLQKPVATQRTFSSAQNYMPLEPGPQPTGSAPRRPSTAASHAAASFADMERRRREAEGPLIDPVSGSDDDAWVDRYNNELAAMVD